MPITASKHDDIAILDVSGKLTIGREEVSLRDEVHKALDEGSRRVLLVLKGVSRCDSSGIGELMAAYTAAKNQGAELKLAELSPKVSSILQITMLVGVLETFDTVEEALADFKGLH